MVCMKYQCTGGGRTGAFFKCESLRLYRWCLRDKVRLGQHQAAARRTTPSTPSLRLERYALVVSCHPRAANRGDFRGWPRNRPPCALGPEEVFRNSDTTPDREFRTHTSLLR